MADKIGLTEEQRDTINDSLESWWNDHISESVLTKEQIENPEQMKTIAFEMEEILSGFAASFGLAGTLAGDEEE